MEEGEGSATPLCTKAVKGGQTLTKCCCHLGSFLSFLPRSPWCAHRKTVPICLGLDRQGAAPQAPSAKPTGAELQGTDPRLASRVALPIAASSGGPLGLHVEGSTGPISCFLSEPSLHGPAPQHLGATAGCLKREHNPKKTDENVTKRKLRVDV